MADVVSTAIRDADSPTDAANYHDLAFRMRALAQHEQDHDKQRELVETAMQYERLAARLVGEHSRRDGVSSNGV